MVAPPLVAKPPTVEVPKVRRIYGDLRYTTPWSIVVLVGWRCVGAAQRGLSHPADSVNDEIHWFGEGALVPLTGLTADGSIADSTNCDDVTWATLYKVKNRPHILCRSCNARMHAKVSSAGLRFFAHDARPVACDYQGESVDHLTLKRRVAELIRELGHEAILEAVPAVGDIGGWRADVLGVGVAARRVAFEVQLSGMTIDEGLERTAKYGADGITVVWISTKHARWMSSLPSARVVVEDEQMTADRGLARLKGGWFWRPAGKVDFTKVVQGMLNGRITAVHARYFTEKVGEREFWIDEPIVLASTTDAAHFQEHIEYEHQEQERLDAERARRDAHLQALVERQERVLQGAIRAALDEGAPVNQIWLGSERYWWNGVFPAPQKDAQGDEKTGYGAPIWIGQVTSDTRLWAIICPVASRCTPEIGASLRKQDVRIFVETDREAASVASTLGWRPREVTVISAE